MAAEKAHALVLKTTDWSESSRIATLWTREFGKVRVLAKGGRRLRSSFENALDLLTVCSIVFFRKSSGSLDLLTEAQVVQRFPRLGQDLAALYGGYYLAELLSEMTQEYDPHPTLFDEAVATLGALGADATPAVGPRLARFELVLLRELGFVPALEACAGCGGEIEGGRLGFSPAAGGVVCGRCRGKTPQVFPLSAAAWQMLRALAGPDEGWRRPWDRQARAEVRQVLNQHVTWILGAPSAANTILGELMAVNTFHLTRPVRRWLLAAVCAGAGGCSWDQFTLVKPPTPPPPPVDGFVLRPDGMTPEKQPTGEGAAAQLAGAHELFRREEYEKAERLCHYLAENKKNPPALVQEARFYEAESLRLQGSYPKAADTYADLMKKFRNNPYRDQCNQHMFDIATFWLEETWAQMREEEQKRHGERWVVWPRLVSLEKKKPLFDREGRALEILDQVRFNDMKGPLADKALFLAGHVKLFNEDYREAEQYFTQIQEQHPKSPFAAQAIELAIFSKQMATGGADYDGRKVAEARKLVDAALRMPEMDDAKKQALVNQLKSITAQQAEKDFKMAAFYRRTNHPGSAYFYYEIVRRRYPGTEYAQLAAEKMMEMRAEVEKKNGEERRDPGSAVPEAPRRFPAVPELAPPPRSVPSGLDR